MLVDDELWVSDEELAAEALAADPEVALGDDAVPFGDDDAGFALLPAWYMPAGGRSRHTRVTAMIILLIVGSLLLAEAFGLCLTSGRIEIPL